jgi:hypothetical protein
MMRSRSWNTVFAAGVLGLAGVAAEAECPMTPEDIIESREYKSYLQQVSRTINHASELHDFTHLGTAMGYVLSQQAALMGDSPYRRTTFDCLFSLSDGLFFASGSWSPSDF